LQRATGCGAEVVQVNSERELAHPGREAWAKPAEGVLVRSAPAS